MQIFFRLKIDFFSEKKSIDQLEMLIELNNGLNEIINENFTCYNFSYNKIFIFISVQTAKMEGLIMTTCTLKDIEAMTKDLNVSFPSE